MCNTVEMFGSAASGSPNQIWSILLVAVLLGSILVFYFSPSYTQKILVAAPGPFDLSKQETIVQEQESQSFYSASNGSFSAFVYLNPMNRTGAYSPCGTNPNQASCSDGTFGPCTCDSDTGDCTVCAHTGYKSVFNISGIVGLEVLIAPDASRQGKAMAQLIVKTEGPPLNSGSSPGDSKPMGATSQKYIETLSLPPIPLQKWTYVTVAREGRRFDVYFNNTIVLSQKTMNMPISNVSNSSMGGITSGSTGLLGQLAVADLYNYRLTTKDVSAKYSQYADTRGRPYLNTVTNPMTLNHIGGIIPSYAATFSTSIFGYIPSFSLCPPGGCFNAPTIQPASPLYDWSTQYQ
jgi:hypothetical protein